MNFDEIHALTRSNSSYRGMQYHKYMDRETNFKTTRIIIPAIEKFLGWVLRASDSSHPRSCFAVWESHSSIPVVQFSEVHVFLATAIAAESCRMIISVSGLLKIRLRDATPSPMKGIIISKKICNQTLTERCGWMWWYFTNQIPEALGMLH